MYLLLSTLLSRDCSRSYILISQTSFIRRRNFYRWGEQL